ncbi:hypothetical protein BO71DRAFT_420846 [Aspergillus ellipticus CBS 707.79]|uniref:Uncharacterized protein n=1 Tax=Aspergillus ellipticus CBS 707.79 TaxID=1448320 RepID=A0A319D4Q4_9EURO|nr:hypothetical protein BO71DRAFT_420846 [Aspergillus ellipticus CBS 707.79]
MHVNRSPSAASPPSTSSLSLGANIETRFHGTTPLLAATSTGHIPTIRLLLDFHADITARTADGSTIIKLALDGGHTAVVSFLLSRFPHMLITDPRHPKGREWLRRQFRVIRDNVTDEQSKPPWFVLERILSGELGPVAGRSVLVGDVQMDISRNYAAGVRVVHTGTFDGVFVRHEGVRESAGLLNGVLPTTEYDVVGTRVEEGEGWVVERWRYRDKRSGVEVMDGVDWFWIRDGRICVKWIYYTVQCREGWGSRNCPI